LLMLSMRPLATAVAVVLPSGILTFSYTVSQATFSTASPNLRQ